MSRWMSLALLLALVATPALAVEVTQSSYVVRGDSADVNFWSGDECVSTSAWISVSEAFGNSHGDRQAATGGWMNFSRYNWCDYAETWGWVDLAGATFDGNGVRGSTLQYQGTGYTDVFLGCETITCGCVEEEFECEPGVKCRQGSCVECDEATGACDWCWCSDEGCFRDVCSWETRSFPVSVDLTWTPEGYTSRGNSHSTFTTPWGRVQSRAVGTSAACSVEGDVLIDGVDFAVEAGYGSSSTYTTGEVFIQRSER